MTLAFSTHINGKPTYFTNKIAKCIWQTYPLLFTEYVNNQSAKDRELFDKIEPFGNVTIYEQEQFRPKLHTIRKDEKNRWKSGNKIHPVINNRTKDRFQFAPTMVCKSVQEIEIKYIHEIQKYHSYTDIWAGGNRRINVYIDGHMIGSDTLRNLAINDGFESVEAFFQWFKDDFKGKIIHWTDLKY